MLTSDQERALEVFSHEVQGRRVTVRELGNGTAVFKSAQRALVVAKDGQAWLIAGRRRRPSRAAE